MSNGPKIDVALFVVVLAGAGVAIRGYFKIRDEAGARQVVARGALMLSEELVWTLEGECLKDAERILSEANAKKIATTAEGAEGGGARIETRLREYLRVRRDEKIWRAAERAFITGSEDVMDVVERMTVHAVRHLIEYGDALLGRMGVRLEIPPQPFRRIIIRIAKHRQGESQAKVKVCCSTSQGPARRVPVPLQRETSTDRTGTSAS